MYWKWYALWKLQYIEYDLSENYHDFINVFYGFVEVDIYTPEELKNYFSEFPLVFKNVDIPIIENGKTKMQRKLISSYKGEKILFKSNYLQFMIQKGMVVTKIYCYSTSWN